MTLFKAWLSLLLALVNLRMYSLEPIRSDDRSDSTLVTSNSTVLVPCSKTFWDQDGDCIPGIPATDYPTFGIRPKSSFSCERVRVRYLGYFADVETGCQMYHICTNEGRQHSFLCPNGTVFNQRFLVCDWWFNVPCLQSPALYHVNDFLVPPFTFKVPPGVSLPDKQPRQPKAVQPDGSVEARTFGTSLNASATNSSSGLGSSATAKPILGGVGSFFRKLNPFSRGKKADLGVVSTTSASTAWMRQPPSPAENDLVTQHSFLNFAKPEKQRDRTSEKSFAKQKSKQHPAKFQHSYAFPKAPQFSYFQQPLRSQRPILHVNPFFGQPLRYHYYVMPEIRYPQATFQHYYDTTKDPHNSFTGSNHALKHPKVHQPQSYSSQEKTQHQKHWHHEVSASSSSTQTSQQLRDPLFSANSHQSLSAQPHPTFSAQLSGSSAQPSLSVTHPNSSVQYSTSSASGLALSFASRQHLPFASPRPISFATQQPARLDHLNRKSSFENYTANEAESVATSELAVWQHAREPATVRTPIDDLHDRVPFELPSVNVSSGNSTELVTSSFDLNGTTFPADESSVTSSSFFINESTITSSVNKSSIMSSTNDYSVTSSSSLNESSVTSTSSLNESSATSSSSLNESSVTSTSSLNESSVTSSSSLNESSVASFSLNESLSSSTISSTSRSDQVDRSIQLDFQASNRAPNTYGQYAPGYYNPGAFIPDLDDRSSLEVHNMLSTLRRYRPPVHYAHSSSHKDKFGHIWNHRH